MTRTLPLLLLAGVLLSAACWQSEGPASGDPITVTPVLDESRRAEGVIPASGGSLRATGADGTTFQLDVPAGALAVDTLIRMTPVSRLDGMPFGSAPYAVQLEPDGLQFYDFATLTITPPQEIPVDQQIPFSYKGTGQNLALALPVVDSRQIQVRLLGFSGYGVTKGLLAEIEPVRARLGGEAESRLQSELAAHLIQARQAQLLGGEAGDFDMDGWLRRYREQVLRPRLAAAGESCAAARLAIQTVLALERQSQILGGAANVGDDTLRSLAQTAADVCLKEEYELCRDEHTIHRIIPVWLTLHRQAQILGLASAGAPDPALEQARDYVRRCLSFELRFESEGQGNGFRGGEIRSSVTSTVKLQVDPADFVVKGQGPLVNTAFEVIIPDCSVSNERGGGTFEVLKLDLVVDPSSPADAVGRVRDLRLVYDPGQTSERARISCPDVGSFTLPGPWWTAWYFHTHMSEITAEGYVLEGWEMTGGEPLARKAWSKDYVGDGYTLRESGEVELYHRPE